MHFGFQRRLRSWLMLVVGVLMALTTSDRHANFAHAADGSGIASPPVAPPAQPTEDCGPAGVCPLDTLEPETELVPLARTRKATLLFFWGVGCPHCEQAKPFVNRLEAERPALAVERIEVRKDPAGRKRFLETMRRLGVEAGGVPTFVVGDRYIVGFIEGTTEKQVTQLVDDALRGRAATKSTPPSEGLVSLPILGKLNPSAMPLPAFTVAIGLVDGINPCAMWVLLVLLGILSHVRSTRRLLMVGVTFVVMSGIIYFIFMTAWLSLFQLAGLSRQITMGLGVVILLMGLINLKVLAWFKKGISLTIPDRVKPGLYRRMRGVANSVSVPAALIGVAALAFFVNLIELACTLGLPAVYTRVLSLEEQLSSLERYGYLVLYNLAYVLPLALIVVVYAATLRRLALGERGAKWLKGVSGTLLVIFGTLFIVAPDLLT